MAPRAAFFCSLLAFVVIVAVASGPAVLAQRTSQGVVTPGDPIWAGAQEPQEPQEPPNNGNDALEAPVLDLQDHQPQVGPDDDEVRVPAVHRDVVVDEVVLGQAVAEGAGQGADRRSRDLTTR